MKKRVLDKKVQRTSPKSSSTKQMQNFGLTEEDFQEMISEMKNGNEILFEKVFLSQFENCITFLMNQSQVSHSQAYDATMDALLKFRKRLLQGKIAYGNMRFLFNRMATQLLLDSFKRKTVLLDNTADIINETETDDEQIIEILEKAWNQLCNNCRHILELFYYQKIALKTLAQQIEKTEVAVRKQKQRCLDKLRLHFIKYYNSL